MNNKHGDFQTWEQLHDYIKTFGKSKGEFSKDEIYLIGLQHKNLPVSIRSWKKLVDILGYRGKKSSLRNYIYRRQKRDEFVNVFSSVVGEQDPDLSGLVSKINDSENLAEKQEAFYIQQTKARNAVNKYRKMLRDEARVQEFKEEIISAIKDLPELPEPEPASFVNTTEKTKEAVLMVSDIHVGAVTDNFYNKYNYKIAWARSQKLIDDVKRYCKIHSPKTLHILNMGDLIQGLIHTSGRIQQEFIVTTQVIKAAELMAYIISELQNCAPKVIYRGCTDNHARLVANIKEHIEGENFSAIIDWYLEERLSGSKVEFSSDNIDKSFGVFELENGKNVAFAHGHLDSPKMALQNFVGATRKFVHYVLLAHRHTEDKKSYQGLKVISNGSMVGTEDYALSRRLFSDPSQMLLIFEEENVMEISIGLKLESEDKNGD